jgi:predicted Zn-dependent protease
MRARARAAAERPPSAGQNSVAIARHCNRMGGYAARHCAAVVCICAGLTLPGQTDALDPHNASWRPLVISGQAIEWPHGMRNAAPELTYAFAVSSTRNDSAVNCRTLEPLALRDTLGREISHARIAQAVADAFSRWSSVAPLTFRPASDPAAADIVIGAHADAHGSAFTDVELGESIDTLRRSIKRATICLDRRRAWKIGFDGDLATYDLTHVVTHEIGHALGLDHPGARGAVMAFKYDESRAGLAAADILGIRAIYGRR